MSDEYEAPVVCINCTYRGLAKMSVGTDVWGGKCPLCCCKGRLRPDNEWMDDEYERMKGLFS